MRIMCDANIILDLLLDRQPFVEDSYKILSLCEEGEILGYVSASCITDIFYIVRKYTHSTELSYKAIGKGYQFEFDVKRIGEIFMIACLLHDVGHAPFSHTGEEFYLDDDKKFIGIHNKLIEVVSAEKFAGDVPQEKTAAAAPHEIISWGKHQV